MRYVLIVGGELFNKGAQAMTFALIQEIKRRYSDKEIILLSTDDYKRKQSEKELYGFRILPWNRKMVFSLAFYGGGILCKFLPGAQYINETKELRKILKDTDVIYDINGYALSSQFGSQMSYLYLLNIKIAKKNNIKMYLLPQSFGPFNYDGIHNYLLNRLIKKYMKYPIKVFAREKDGIKCLENKISNNLVKSYDLVLHTSEPDEKLIYKKSNNDQYIKIIDNSIAIVPNMQTIRHGSKIKLFKLYYEIINTLLEQNMNIYLISHSYEDTQLCKEIKENYKSINKVVLIDKELSCFQYNKIVSKFNFIISSRYHAIIHAYKKGTPAIVFGWAIKYKELLETFEQSKFLFDVRDSINLESVIDSIEDMNKNLSFYKSTIIKHYNKIREDDILNQHGVFNI